MQDVPPFDVKLEQQGPIEIPPGAELEVDQSHQHEKNDRIRKVFSIFHPV